MASILSDLTMFPFHSERKPSSRRTMRRSQAEVNRAAAPSAAAIEQVRASIEATDDEALHRSLHGLWAHDTTDRLDAVDVPAFVVVGARDILTPVSMARRLVGRAVRQSKPQTLTSVQQTWLRRLASATRATASTWSR